jgi:hypothetical protein
VIISASGLTSTQVATGALRIGTPGSETLEYEWQNGKSNGAIDSTTDQVVEVTFQWVTNASTNLSARCLAVHLEKI